MGILQGDALTRLKELETESVDLIVTDPPYGYQFMNKEWDKAVIGVETWKECLRVLKSGAFAFIMSSPRQDVLSRMIVNLQDAGFETNFTSLYHTFASGFPKAANTTKILAKRGINRPDLENSYAGAQMKPAVEVILIVMKPLSEKSYVDQALANRKGITWLDDCRIPYQSEEDENSAKIRYPIGERNTRFDPKFGWNQNNMINLPFNPEEKKGRFPANILVSDDALNDGKNYKSGPVGFKGELFSPSKGWNNNHMKRVPNKHNDSGSFSRYFSLDSWAKTLPFLIVPKPSAAEKNLGLDEWIPKKVNDGRKTEIDNPFQRGETPRFNTHPTVKPLKLMSYLITMGSRESDLILDPFCGSGTTCISAQLLNRKWLGIEANQEYVDIANARLKPYLQQTRLI